ncbi:MAG TPA: hypothetical protein VJJ21_03960 [Candidatus Nanoarchaeia archaeon]|nr:hypothetical protein [Candidatus Nanoarchaeia archaeon]
MKFSIILIITILIATSVSATQLLREIQPENPKTQDIILVKISLLNENNLPGNYEIEEILPGEITLIEPSSPTEIKQRDGISISTLKWNINAEPGKVSTISYTLKANKPGQLSFSPLEVTSDSGDSAISNSNELTVYCSPNNICDKSENYLNCPQDCTTGAQDGICNPIQDSICDQDCTKGADSDCKDQKSSFTWIYYLLSGIILLAIIIFVIMKLKKQSPEPVIQQPQQPLQQPNQQKEQDPLSGFPGSRNI